MSSVEKIVARMREAPNNVDFADLHRVCSTYFGKPRERGSHVFFPMPWPGDPRVNIQNDKGKAKRYQVKQVLDAIDKLSGMKKEGC